MFGFEKLEVWQKAIDFADTVYLVTRHFPADERFGLTNQMRRAAVSISSKIAEGSARISKKDFARFIEIAGKADPFVEHETFTMVMRATTLFKIFQNAAIELINVVESILNHVRRRFFATNSTGTEGDNRLLLE